MNQDSLQTDITFIKSIMKTWEDIPAESFLFERLPGLTNVIYKVAVTYPGVTPTCAIFRKFGNSGEIIDLEKENYVFKELAKRGVGPLYYGGDKSYRLEEYFDSTVLEPNDVHKKAIRRSIAKALAALHQAQVEGIEKAPMFMKTIDQGFWKKLVNDKVRKEQFTPEEEGWIQEILTLIGDKEVKFLKDLLADEKNTVVFSHNDLHARNILLLDKSEQVKLVDYEYSAYNYRGYDIANFMNESAIDYSSSDYPYYTLDVEKALKKEDLEDFVQYYLFFSKFNGVSCDEALLLNDNSYLHAVIKETGSLEEFNQEASDLLEEVKICAMLSHYYWILWSVVMSKNDEIQFDYLHYAHGRFVQYQNLKKEYNSSKSSTEHATSETD